MRSLADAPAASADLTKRTRWYWGIGIGQILATIALVLGVSVYSGLVATYLFLLSAATYLPAYVGVSIWLARFKCPRCGHRWLRLIGGMPPPFATKCSHCRLPRG